MKNKSENNNYSKKLFKISILIIFFLIIVHLILQYININLLNEAYGTFYEITNRFDLDDEVALGTWVAQAQFLLLAVLCFTAAFFVNIKPEKFLWKLLGAGALLASIDEVSGFHEVTLQGLHNIFFRDQQSSLLVNAWIIAVPFVLAIIVWFGIKAYKIIDKKLLATIMIAAAVFLVGAVGVDQLSAMADNTSFVQQGVLVAIEEGLELISVSIIVFAVASFIETNYSQRISSAIKYLKH